MLKIKRVTGFYRFLLAGSLVWISSTGFAAKTDDHAGQTADGSQATATAKPTATKPTATGDDKATRRTAALKRMKDELKKLGNTSLRQLTGQVAQFQKVDPDILGGIVDKLPDLNEDSTKSLKDTFKEVFPELGDTADADLARVLAELGIERFGDDENGDGKKDDDKKTDEEKVKEALDKILKEKEDELAKKEEEAKKLADQAKDDFNKQLDGILKAAGLDPNADKNKNDDLAGLGDIPPPDDAGAGAGDTGGGSGGGDSGGGSGSGGGGDKGASTPTDTGNKNSKTDTGSNKGLDLSNNKSETAKAATPKEEEPFSLDSEKKKTEDKPSTIQTGAKEPAASGEPPQSDVVDPSTLSAPAQPFLAGSSSAASGVTPFQSSLADTGSGGGSGAGIQINGASAPSSSGGEGDPFSNLGNGAAQPPEDRGRFFYQRTSDKDWVSSGGSVDEESSGSDGGGDAPAYGSKPSAPTLASLGIGSARDESGSAVDGPGVFSANPVRKLCKSSVGSSIGVCGTRAVKASPSKQTMPARSLGSLYEKARASGFIREAR